MSERLKHHLRRQASLFAALGDQTRLGLMSRLSAGEPQSITRLSADFSASRQSITRHLRVLENEGLVVAQKRGRETIYAFTPAKIAEARRYLEQVSDQWDRTLDRLKAFVENSRTD